MEALTPVNDGRGWTYRARPGYGKQPKVVARLENGILRAHKSKSKDLYRIFNAWTFDEAIIDHAKSQGLKMVVVIDRESNITYTTEAENFKHAIKDQRLPQYHLSLNHWKASDDPQAELFTDYEPDPPFRED